jgi:hypothetical protein
MIGNQPATEAVNSTPISKIVIAFRIVFPSSHQITTGKDQLCKKFPKYHLKN